MIRKFLPVAILAAVLLVISGVARAAIDPACPVAKSPLAVTLTWTPPTTQATTPPSPLGANQLPLSFSVFMTTTKGGEALPALINGLTGTTTSISTGFLPNTSYYFTMTTVDALGQSSTMTNEVCASTGPNPPSTFSITITAT